MKCSVLKDFTDIIPYNNLLWLQTRTSQGKALVCHTCQFSFLCGLNGQNTLLALEHKADPNTVKQVILTDVNLIDQKKNWGLSLILTIIISATS